MYRSEKTVYRQEMDHNPSFSSTLLDKIYRSIDDGDTKNGDMKFYRETMQKKQSKVTMKSHREYDHHDVHFFSSTSTSSDSSSGGFSSSDNESMHVTKSKSSCFVTSRPKPVPSEKPHKTERKQRTLFDDHYSSAAKIYGNSKKAKQPISPGGRLASFINSLFTASNTKKARGPSSILSCEDERKLKYEQDSTCSSASSFSRSCLSKNSSSTRERLRNGVKRSVRFYEGEEDSSSVSVTIPAVWRITTSPSRKLETKRVEEMATKFLKEYRLNQTKNDYILSNYVMEEIDEDEDEDDDDAASYSSSDLFELDHRVLIGNYRYREELPVYETTHVDTNRAIANGLIA